MVSDHQVGPVTVVKYLLPRESLVASMRQHPALLVQPTAVALGAVAAAAAVDVVRQDSRIAVVTAWTLAILLVLRWWYLMATWTVQSIVITSARLIIMSGLASTRILSFDIQDLRYCTFERSYGGRLLGYGTIKFDSGPRGRTLVDFLPYPEHMYLLINNIIYPQLAAADGPELDGYDADLP